MESKYIDPKYCTRCGGYAMGLKDGEVCEECGTVAGNASLAINTRKDRNKFIDNCIKNTVPEQYIGIDWDKNILMSDHKEWETNFGFNKLVNQMDRIKDIFASGQIPSKSFFLSAPAKCSKITWTYYCMQLAMDRGFKVARLLDTMELRRLMILSSENVHFKLYNTVNYDEYMASDVLFITVTKTEYLTEACNAIIELLDRRSRLGLPVFIISRYSLETLKKYDKRDMLKNIEDMNKFNNEYKYPAIIQFHI